jgi:hypothetical protein
MFFDLDQELVACGLGRSRWTPGTCITPYPSGAIAPSTAARSRGFGSEARDRHNSISAISQEDPRLYASAGPASAGSIATVARDVHIHDRRLAPEMALFCKFRSVSPIAFLLVVISGGGLLVQYGLLDIGLRVLGEVEVHVHNLGSGDMLPSAPCLQSFQFVQRSQHRSGMRSFVSQEV